MPSTLGDTSVSAKRVQLAETRPDVPRHPRHPPGDILFDYPPEIQADRFRCLRGKLKITMYVLIWVLELKEAKMLLNTAIKFSSL